MQYDRDLSIIVEIYTIKSSSTSQESFLHKWLQFLERTFNRIWAGELFRKGPTLNTLYDSSPASSTSDNERRGIFSSNFSGEPVDAANFVRNCNSMWAAQITQATTLLNFSQFEYFSNKVPQKFSFSAHALMVILSFFTRSSWSKSS